MQINIIFGYIYICMISKYQQDKSLARNNADIKTQILFRGKIIPGKKDWNIPFPNIRLEKMSERL